MKTTNTCWWKEAVVYQIYPRSFMDSNGDGIGDLRGIISRLDYLKKLGIDVIWMSPVYQSPNDDNGYDISDYQAIMEEFGTMEDFDQLLSRAHERGLKIVMDLVVNHTSDEHRWFVESRKGKGEPYGDYYIWRDGKEDGSAPNNWGSCFGGSAWQYDEERGQYYLHLFSKKQPDLNWDNPQVRKEVFDMMNWWCEKGIDGFRMDVISMISKTEQMPDGEVREIYGDFAPYCVHGPNVHQYLWEMNQEVLSKYDLMTVGETAGVTPEQACLYAGEDTHELNTVFHFEHVDNPGMYGKWNADQLPLTKLKAILSRWQTELCGKAWNSLYWDNHDQPRAVSRFGNDDPAWRELSAKMLATCLHMMQGTPYIYQGEELGMTNYPFQGPKDFHDIESIQAYEEWCGSGRVSHEAFWPCITKVSRDNARTPMQWDDTEQAGFTTGTPWMPVNPNYREINAKAALEDPDSVFYYYQKLISLRKEYPVIVHGTYQLLLADSEELFVYERAFGAEKLLVACSFVDKETEFQVPEEFAEGKRLISNYKEPGRDGKLRPYEAFVIYVS
ncbi:MAG: alpha-glucosidase [Firmicutes bacterium]|nr:alpha-glucosidase [Bacillota bacterium]NBI63962.1 alpha-glucosidase [Clostridiales bacterium]